MTKRQKGQDAQWIWIDGDAWPAHQRCPLTLEDKPVPGQRFGVAAFTRTYTFEKEARSAALEVSGDTKFWLDINGRFIGQGPVCVGGDFGQVIPPSRYFLNHYEVALEGRGLRIDARVQLSPAVLLDMSHGQGGFYLRGTVRFADGSTREIGTDESWQGRLLPCYLSPTRADFTLPEEQWLPAVPRADVWQAEKAGIPMLDERFIQPQGADSLRVPPGKSAEILLTFDRIYAGYLTLKAQCDGPLTVDARISETHRPPFIEEGFVAGGKLSYRGLRMHSIGQVRLTVQNNSGSEAVLTNLGLVASEYPVAVEGGFSCSDNDLNRIHEVCKWTLRICRQTIHLDSPLHQELLACTGDYYIESLMNYFTFADPRLTRLDLIRTADRLSALDGRMFHTSYSLTWVQMLYDYYLFTADRDLLLELSPALHTLLARFHRYEGQSGLLENPPDYMFVDWTVVDGYSLHHPPKALGQTSLNCFYHNALLRAADICGITADPMANTYLGRAMKLKTAFNQTFWDAEKGLYFDGLNDETPSHRWLPKNSQKRYFTKYGNTLAVLYGLCDGERGRTLMERMLSGDELPDVQPYFMHYFLEALSKTVLFERHGLSLIRRWTGMVDECDKGLKEGWFAPEEGYQFDYSHAWGGTPAYQLPCKLLGFEMLEPGFRKIRLRPRLMGLAWADIEIHTPFGPLRCQMKANEKPALSAPEGIELELLT